MTGMRHRNSRLGPAAVAGAACRARTLTGRLGLAGLGHSLADRVKRHLADGAAKLSASHLRVVFGGHFSSGKSSMINMLICQPLLPTSNYPETGVPCVISTGATDSIRVVAGSQQRSAPFSTDSIAKSVSLIGADGDYRASPRKITRLDITLAGQPDRPGHRLGGLTGHR